MGLAEHVAVGIVSGAVSAYRAFEWAGAVPGQPGESFTYTEDLELSCVHGPQTRSRFKGTLGGQI